MASVPEDESNGKEVQKKKVTPPLPLDWTKLGAPEEKQQRPVSTPWDVLEYELTPDDTDLTIVGTAGQKITHMGSDLASKCPPNLTSLVLRSHLITKMEGLSGFDSLDLLELYDNQIDALEELNTGVEGRPGITLRVLDMSYNVIRDMIPVSFCPNLQEIYLANNKIKDIKGLKNLSKLRKLDLGANRIRVMDGEELSGLTNLEELWLGKNKIEKIQGLDKLTNLRKLDVQSNRLESVENLEAQVDTLEELYLAHNGITNEGASKATGLALTFKHLNTVDLGRNRLTGTQPFAHLTTLEELWISGNQIASFDDVMSLSSLTKLEGIYLEYNPIADDFEYRKKLAELVPNLNQIDANMIGGLAAHGIPPAPAVAYLATETTEERLRRLQEAVIARASAETKLLNN